MLVKCCICGEKSYKKLYDISRTEGAFAIVKCSKCGHIYQNPRMGESEIKKSYSRKRDFYRSLPRETNKPAFDFINSRRLKKIEKFTKGNVLDVGCAFGNFLRAAKMRGWNTHGAEIDKNAIGVARKNGKIFFGTLENARYNKCYFDAITMFDVIEHVPDPVKTLQEANRIIKKNGLLVIQTPAADSIYAKITGKNWDYYGLQHLNYFSKKDMKTLLKKMGFQINKIYYGDEIGLIASIRGFVLNKENKRRLLPKFILTQIMRHIHIGNISFGAKVYYATKI